MSMKKLEAYSRRVQTTSRLYAPGTDHRHSDPDHSLDLDGGAAGSVTIKREKERMNCARDLWEMRDAIDRYKDAADRGGFQTKVDSQNYPPDLETLVKGVDVQGKEGSILAQDSCRSHDWHHRVGLAFDAG
jgi:hypothetical protein